MKKIFSLLIILAFIAGCSKEITQEDQIQLNSHQNLTSTTMIPEGMDIPDFSDMILNYNQNAKSPMVLKSAGPAIKFGIWYPYESNFGVPAPATFALHGIQAEFISGDINAAVLEYFDVIFIGRSGMIKVYYPGVGDIEDIDALIEWINNGGSIIGESESLIFDSDAWQGKDWSSRLSQIAGVWSSEPNGVDLGSWGENVTIASPGHPIATGVSLNFPLIGYYAIENPAYTDPARNPSAVKVAVVGSAPIVAAEYGSGNSVYFPTALGLSGWFDWSVNPNYELLFINAVKWCGPKVKTVEIDVMPGDYPNYFTNDGKGVLPVAILGSEELDVSEVDVSSLLLDEMPVQMTKKGEYMAHFEDVNMDGTVDLVLQFKDVAGTYLLDDTMATLTGKLLSDVKIKGTDEITILPKQ